MKLRVCQFEIGTRCNNLSSFSIQIPPHPPTETFEISTNENMKRSEIWAYPLGKWLNDFWL